MKYCLGTAQFGMDYGIQGGHQPAYERVDEIIGLAIDKGIDHFDCAPVYGEAEDVLGYYIRHHSAVKDKLHIVSKLPAKAFAAVPRDNWPEVTVQRAKKDRDSLGVNILEAYLFHDASYIFDPDAVYAIDKVRTSGIAEKTGVSVYTPAEALKALNFKEISVIQVPYNLFDCRLEESGFFDKAAEKGIEIYARSSLLQGLLMMDPERLPDRMRFAGGYLKTFRKICSRYGVTPLEAAVGYVTQDKRISYVVFGVDNMEQLEEYLSVQGCVIPADMVAELRETFSSVEEKLVNPTLW